MIESDKKLFKQTLDLMCDGFNETRFEKETLKTWFDKLIDYSIDDLISKIDLYCEEHKKIPALADLIEKHSVTIKPRNETPLTLDNKKAYMSEFKNEANKFKSDKGKDWARKILNSPKGKSPLQLKYAREALGLSINSEETV